MTIIERLQGAGLSFIFLALCFVVGRSMIRESSAGPAHPPVRSVMVMPGNPGSDSQASQPDGSPSTESAGVNTAIGTLNTTPRQ